MKSIFPVFLMMITFATTSLAAEEDEWWSCSRKIAIHCSSSREPAAFKNVSGSGRSRKEAISDWREKADYFSYLECRPYDWAWNYAQRQFDCNYALPLN